MQKFQSVRTNIKSYRNKVKNSNRVRAGSLFVAVAFALMSGFALYQVTGGSKVASADPVVSNYPLPGTSSSNNPLGITAGPDGNLWVTGYQSDDIYRVTPGGTVTTFPIPTANAGPYDITAGPDGNLWFTEEEVGNKIGRITPSGVITEYTLPSGQGRFPFEITTGPDGNLWFTMAGNGAYVGNINPTTGAVAEYPIPLGGMPYGITSGPNHALWFTENDNTIGEISTSGTYTPFTIPNPGNSDDTYGITAGPDGNIWYAQTNGEIGRLNPSSGAVTLYPVTATQFNGPQSITVGPDGALWFSTSAGYVGRITTTGNITYYSELPTVDGGSVSPGSITSGPDNSLWFSAAGANSIGSITASVSQVAPTNLTASSPTTSSPALSWSASAGADSYNIYRNGVKIGSSTTTSYTDTSAPQGSYSYYVTAVYSGTQTAPSNTVAVVYDTSPPTISYGLSPEPNSAGWVNGPVTVTFNCSDAISGIASCTAPQTLSTSGANQTVTGTAVNNAGESASVTATVNVDTSAPTISYSLSPAPNASGWNNGPVTVTFNCSDAISGIASCSAPQTLSSNGANQTVTGTATSNSGASTSVTATVNIDSTVPTITATVSPTPNVAGWNNSPVTVSFSCSDAISGIATCPSPVSVTANGVNQTVTGTAVNNAGTTATATATVNLDQTPPSLGTPAWSSNPLLVGNTSELTVPVSDGVSGVLAGEYSIDNGSVVPMTYDGANLDATIGSGLNPGTYTVSVTAENTAGVWSSPVTTQLVVRPPAAPTNLSGPEYTDQNPDLTWSTDPDATLYNVYRNGSYLGSSSTNSFVDSTTPQGSNTYYVTAATVNGFESAASNTISVVYDTSTPTITYSLSPAPNGSGWNNSPVTVMFSCGDPVSGIASCTAPQTLSSNGANQTVTGTATSNSGETTDVTATINIDASSPVLSTPNWTANPLTQGQTDNLSVPASDTISGIVGGEYSIDNGSVVPMTYDGANLDASLGSNLAPGSYTITIMAESTAGVWSSPTTTTLIVNSATTAPTITSAAAASTGMNVSFSFTVTTSGTPTASVSETGALPSGVTLVDNGDGTATLSGMAAAGTNGTYPITITASNGTNPNATQHFVLTVTTATATPVITSADSDTETFGVAFSFTVTATGYPIPTITKTGTLPAGVKFVNNGNGTATISGTPDNSAVGVYTITITAKNSQGTTTQTFTETITKTPVFKAVATKNLTATVGTPYSLTVTVSAYVTAHFSEVGTLPNGLTLTDNGDNTATISGTPSLGDGGTYSITLTATNPNGSDSKTITIKVDAAPTITSSNGAVATPGSTFSFKVTSTGFPAPRYSLTGALPTGVTFNDATGTFSGKPKLTDTVKVYSLTITATNVAGSVSQDFSLTLL